jgi:hypothetical protein
MCLVDFLQHLKRYGQDRLPELMIKTCDSGERNTASSSSLMTGMASI